MKIIFKENYCDEKEENQKGVKETFTAGREYKVSEEFGEKMVKKHKADIVNNLKEEVENGSK